MNRKVFTYKDIEEVRGYIGKLGWFSNSLKEIQTECSRSGTLTRIDKEDYHFEMDGKAYWQFFSPDPEPVETWVPFTAQDSSLFAGRSIRNKKDWFLGVFAIIVSCNLDEAFIISSVDGKVWNIPFRALLDMYEFLDGTPCGKKVTQ